MRIGVLTEGKERPGPKAVARTAGDLLGSSHTASSRIARSGPDRVSGRAAAAGLATGGVAATRPADRDLHQLMRAMES
jgi:hypothetical protein